MATCSTPPNTVPNENLLNPSSYTAHRLHHATPPHLHLTSRRVFVGPLPLGWANDRRTDWYKDHLHYSKRRSSFSAHPNTTPWRSVTGLDGPRERVPEEDVNGFTEPGSPSEPVPIPSLGQSHSSTPTIVPTRRKGKGREVATLPQSDPSSPTTPNRRRPKTSDTNASLATARTRPKTCESSFAPWLNRGESYTTAHETWEHANEYRTKSTTGRVERNEIPPVPTIPTSIMFDEPIAVEHSHGGASTISTPHTLHAQDSLSLLLRKDRDQRRLSDSVDSRLMNLDGLADSIGSPGPSRRQSSIVSSGRKSEQRTSKSPMEELDPMPWTVPTPHVSSTHQERVSGGLVRFNTSDMSAQDRDNEMQQKIADLSRARPLRRRHSSFRQHTGEIVKFDSMLVRIETAHAQQLPEEYDENESLKVNTKTVDKWKEYFVVCRENDDPDIPTVLRLYKNRKIPAIDKQHISSRSTRDIQLNPKTTRVNLYSSLDKTLVLWLPFKRGTLIYIMRPRRSSTSVEWYTFLRRVLGEPPCKTLQISVPDLSLTISINNPFERKSRSRVNVNGNITAIEQQDVAGSLLERSIDILGDVDEWEDILKHWENNGRLGLAWRRYDRLEWVHGTNEERMDGSMAMQKTHELELRPKTHYPTESTLANGDKMIEPPPVEGFLVRLTSGKGREKRLGRYFRKRLYYSCHDQFLCFCRPSRAIPPFPPKRFFGGGIVPTPSEVAERMPLIYCVSPYSLNQDRQIEWLANPTPGWVEMRDQEAYEEAERKVNVLLRAEGFVDLTQAVGVRRMRPERSGRPVSDSGLDGCMDEHSEEESSNAEREADEEECFEVLLENGLVLKLQAFDSQTRDEWILRLSDLIQYWKARHRGDLAVVRQTRATNLKQLGMDEEMESVMGQFGKKWEVSRSTASSELYNVCGISSCRTITMSGILYRKPRRHATFCRYNVILCNGELIIFQHSARSSTGKEIPTIYHDKHLSLSLRDCYVYSGLVTSSDLLHQNQTFDSNSPGRHALPRIFPDGYTAQDEDSMTCFVLWHGARKALFTKMDNAGNKVRRRVSPLGTTGKAIVFKARSRVERDIWVMSIAMEIERLNLGVTEDVEFVSAK